MSDIISINGHNFSMVTLTSNGSAYCLDGHNIHVRYNYRFKWDKFDLITSLKKIILLYLMMKISF